MDSRGGRLGHSDGFRYEKPRPSHVVFFLRAVDQPSLVHNAASADKLKTTRAQELITNASFSDVTRATEVAPSSPYVRLNF